MTLQPFLAAVLGILEALLATIILARWCLLQQGIDLPLLQEERQVEWAQCRADVRVFPLRQGKGADFKSSVHIKIGAGCMKSQPLPDVGSHNLSLIVYRF